MLRYPLSATRDLNLDDMRIALITLLVSRQRGEMFMIRIDENELTDPDEINMYEHKLQDMLALLKKFAVEEEQRFYQSDHVARYQQFALSLLEQKKAFACICDTETIDTGCPNDTCLHNREAVAQRIQEAQLPFVIRLKKPETAFSFTDRVQGEISVDPSDIGNLMILRSDGTPTPDFAAACADMLSHTTLVISSEKELHKIPRQIHIKQALGYTAPTVYAHLPDILSEESVTITHLLEEGFLPDAIINYLLSIGHQTPETVFTLPYAIQWFALEDLSTDAEKFDIDRLRALNRAHLAAMEDKALSRLFGFADAEIGKLLKLYLREASTLNALDSRIKGIFAPKTPQGIYAKQMRALASLIQEAPMLETFEAFSAHLATESGLEDEALLTPLQYLMTGAETSPDLQDIYLYMKPYITEIARCTP